MAIVKKFRKGRSRVSIRQRRSNSIKALSEPMDVAKGYGFSTRRSSLGFPDVVRSTFRYNDSTIALNPGVGTTAIHVFRLNRLEREGAAPTGA